MYVTSDARALFFVVRRPSFRRLHVLDRHVGVDVIGADKYSYVKKLTDRSPILLTRQKLDADVSTIPD